MTLISITEAADLLGIGRTTAYRLAKEGRIPCVRSFGPLRVHAERLQSMIDAEADASVAPGQPRQNRKCHAPNSSKQSEHIGSRSAAQAERELDKLLQIRPK
ncbi:helix-turn-helix domain-containing protein [Pseudomonas gingeri]|uniref:helix-turn-helix domain-containing protein n=1 Tax=Pseudomonas gingeri TaxID=117681 RepID=UPI0015A29CB8|nr:helix-turn-helix domain-containing protein [Pseudomonas gingeri]NWA24083.1 helix-turn-helix domain-containing protein [Pseudomonas gingeri]